MIGHQQQEDEIPFLLPIVVRSCFEDHIRNALMAKLITVPIEAADRYEVRRAKARVEMGLVAEWLPNERLRCRRKRHLGMAIEVNRRYLRCGRSCSPNRH